MNELKSMEEHLQSWTPRRPSLELREGVFGSGKSTERSPAPTRSVLWFIPATACFAAALITLKFGDPSSLGSASSTAFFATIGSNTVAAPFGASPNLASINESLDRNVWTSAVCSYTNEQLWNSHRSNAASRPLTNRLQ